MAVLDNRIYEEPSLKTPGPASLRSGSGSGSGVNRRSSMNKASPNFQKFDAKLKKQLLANEKERTEKAKRDA